MALTAVLLGAGAYLFVENGLRDQVLRDARDQARFDLSVIVPAADLPAAPTEDDIVDSRLLETFQARGVEAIVDLGADGVAISIDRARRRARRAAGRPARPGRRRASWPMPGRPWPATPSLVVGGRVGGRRTGVLLRPRRDRARGGPRRSSGSRSSSARSSSSSSRCWSPAWIARGVLAPVEAASRAAERIERGDLSARVPVTSDDEFGTWAERFNRMAEALAETIGRLEAAEAQNRRFVADVAHELRTPLAALVAEASILREHLDALPPESRRAGELLVADVGRLRTLVDDLMEVSRFDARAEQIALEPVDLGRLVRVGRRGAPARRRPSTCPTRPLVVETDPRRLERILGNLLDNAREHAPGRPVEVTPVGRRRRDRPGRRRPRAGRPARPARRIFERFYKADPSRHGGSSGLGLAIAAEHAALLGGYLDGDRPRGWRPADRAAAACDRIVTCRR